MRVKVTLACMECHDRNYATTKNKQKHPERMEVMKYCPRLQKYTLIKKQNKTMDCFCFQYNISGEVVIMKMETCKDICHTFRMKELYSLRKETIERGSASAKENHEFWYMQMFGKV